MKKYFLLAALLCSISLFAQTTYFPEKNTWQHRSPSEFNINATELQKAIVFAEDNEYSGSRDLRIAILEGFAREPYHDLLGQVKKRGGPAGVILKNGYIVASWGEVERVDMTFSVTKSYLSTVAGLAVDQGLIQHVQDPVGDYVWDGTFRGAHNSKVTWHHLLQQNSDWSGELFGVKDWADRPPRKGDVDDWKMREFNEPGTVFEYNDVRVNVLAYSLLQLFREPLPKVLKEQVMDKIGASPTWRWFGYDHSFTLVDGMMMQSVSGGGHSGGGLWINTLDHARFGYLFLNDGKWKNEQIISENWIEQAIQPSTPKPDYGYMWWLNTKGSNRYMEGIDENVYYAAGFGGNFIVIDEARDMVIVTRWLEPSKLEEFLSLVKAADEEKAEEKISLFNGKNLDGWTIHGTEKWFVKNGILYCESGPDEQYGYLATNEKYKNFDLTLEFKQTANGNSGVFFRSSLEGTKITGWQAEVAPPGNNSGGIYESYGRGWLIKPPKKLDSTLKMGEWNKMRVRVVGDRVTTWLNGTQMIDFKDEKIGEANGQIALQIHDGGGIQVQWRNLELTSVTH
ncbi:MAG: family 16 glycoside hydrolase [Bacteroidota bacterium]